MSTDSTKAMTLPDLIDAYWDCAYAEGKEGRTHDTPDGKAQAIRNAIDAHLAPREVSDEDVERLLIELWDYADTSDDHCYGTLATSLVRDYVTKLRAALQADRKHGGLVVKSAIDDLVARFADALRQKLHAAKEKYGYSDAWMRDDWRETLIRCMHEHIEKGDPRDVAAYCAFAWHHGWKLEALLAQRGQVGGCGGVKVPDGFEVDADDIAIAVRCKDGRKALLRSDRSLTYNDHVLFDFLKAMLAQRGQVREGFEHRWNDDGEQCVKCGDKDWMSGKCSVPDADAEWK